MPRTQSIQQIGCASILSNGLLPLVSVYLLLFAVPALAQVEVRLRYGGTLEGKLIASDDSTVTLSVVSENGETRNAVLRRSDIIFTKGGVDATPVDPEPDEEDGSYRNQISFGVMQYSWSGTDSEITTRRIVLGYEHSFTPRVHDSDHRTAASKAVMPTSYIIFTETGEPLLPGVDRMTTDQLFGGYLVYPELAIGAGFVYGWRNNSTWYSSHYLDESFKLFMPSLRADIFASNNLRLRETAGAGSLARQSVWDTLVTADNNFALHAEHRLDYVIEREQAYSHELMFRYMAKGGSTLRFDNSYEYAFSEYLSISPLVMFQAHFPVQGEGSTSYGIGFNAAGYPSSGLMFLLHASFADEMGPENSSQINLGGLIAWRF